MSTHLESAPPPRTVEQPQACSISRSFMAAPLQNTLQVPSSGGKHSPNPSAAGRDEHAP